MENEIRLELDDLIDSRLEGIADIFLSLIITGG
jgi:hypothetical protein